MIDIVERHAVMGICFDLPTSDTDLHDCAQVTELMRRVMAARFEVNASSSLTLRASRWGRHIELARAVRTVYWFAWGENPSRILYSARSLLRQHEARK